MDLLNTFYALSNTQNFEVDYIIKRQVYQEVIYYIAYVELLTSQTFGDTHVQNAISSILN